MTYLDSSALIKLFVTERGSAFVQRLVARDLPIATAKIAYVEVYAGLSRKRRDGDLPDLPYARACREFEREWQAYVRVDLRDEIVWLARDLVRRHPLRGFDAIHLATALSLRERFREEVTLAAADERLLQASRAEGVAPLHVEEASGK